MDIGESGNRKGELKADDVPYKRLLIQGKDIRHEMGPTFSSPPLVRLERGYSLNQPLIWPQAVPELIMAQL